MRYVQVVNGVFVRHILSDTEVIRWSATHKTSVRKMTDADRATFGIEKLQLVTPPAFDAATQVRVEGDAILANGAWTQVWVVNDLTGGDLTDAQARQAEVDRNASIDGAINADTTIGALKTMTNAEFNTWWAANVTNTTEALNILKRLARVIIRRVL